MTYTDLEWQFHVKLGLIEQAKVCISGIFTVIFFLSSFVSC